MEIKDFASILISSFAFFLSLAATTISIVRGTYEKQRAVKNQITETLSRITTTALEQAKIFHDLAGKEPIYYQNVSSILNQQNTFLLHQAIYLIDQVPDLVTSVEYNTVAAATANAGDLISAEKYYVKAVEVAPNDYYKSLGLRSYGGFLFMQRRFEEGRDQFKKAVSLLRGGDSVVRWTNGLTYQTWAWNELNNALAPQRAAELFESAKNEFIGIDNEAVRHNALNGLDAARSASKSPPEAHDITTRSSS